MFYDTGYKLYLKNSDKYAEVKLCVKDGHPEVIKTGATLPRRPEGAQRFSAEEIIAQNSLMDGETYPPSSRQETHTKAQPVTSKLHK